MLEFKKYLKQPEKVLRNYFAKAATPRGGGQGRPLLADRCCWACSGPQDGSGGTTADLPLDPVFTDVEIYLKPLRDHLDPMRLTTSDNWLLARRLAQIALCLPGLIEKQGFRR
ncbi:MAG: hypothetical protein C5B49_13805 [Bdellovibrio sp.]|nr:MAG: hypothetical protein C5B49_13805 [Bdellovibrio sp.]